MDDYRQRNQKRFRSRDSIERRMDQLFATGRHVVDGVAGTRPGLRRDIAERGNRSRIDNVGRWVEEKLDYFFEDENDWIDTDQQSQKIIDQQFIKRPLGAISLRGPKALQPYEKQATTNDITDDNIIS